MVLKRECLMPPKCQKAPRPFFLFCVPVVGLWRFCVLFAFCVLAVFGSGVLWCSFAFSSFQWCLDGVLSCLWSSVVFARIGVVALLFRGIVRACSACYEFASCYAFCAGRCPPLAGSPGGEAPPGRRHGGWPEGNRVGKHRRCVCFASYRWYVCVQAASPRPT